MNTQQEFIEYLLYIANRCPNITLTKLYKFFWFANLEYAERYGSLMVKDVFIKKKFGPVPEEGKDYIDMVREMPNQEDENIKLVFKQETYISIFIKAKRAENPDYFTDAEKEVLDAIITKYGRTSATEISDLSHDTAWNEADMHRKVDITKDIKKREFVDVIREQYDDVVFVKQMRTYA
ncbi:SocA family protein [Candidatus Gracilibacteria bacterium]|nr:SocA family protein [Candidatus Gracilibacteria bacterium]